MKFKEQKVEPWKRSVWFKGRNKGFVFEYSKNGNKWYCVVSHTKKDIRFNSLWEELMFENEEEVHKFCETWDYKKHQCLGKDVDSKKTIMKCHPINGNVICKSPAKERMENTCVSCCLYY